MGIAAGEAQIGDLICCIPEVPKAVIVRVDGHWAQIIGTAALPRGLYSQVIEKDSTEYFGSNEEVELSVDVQSVYLLQFQKELRSSVSNSSCIIA
jgi:hypothetical protein